MTRMKVTRTGRSDVGFLDRFNNEVLDQMAEEGRDWLKREMGAPGPGPASEPGEVPNRQTSDLYDHTIAVRTAVDESQIQITRPSGDPRIPGWLNDGTPGGKVAARPMGEPANEYVYSQMDRIVDESATRAGR